MRATLQDQLLYLERLRNPNYIIILGHKTQQQDMDFSQFKPVIPETKAVYKPQLRYDITCTDIEGDKVLIQVQDTFVGRETFRGIYPSRVKEEQMKAIKKMYKGTDVLNDL